MLTDSSRPNSQVIEAFSLCMFLYVCTFYPTLPSGPSSQDTTGAPAPGSSRDPVSLRSRSRNDSNTVSVLVSLMHLLQSPLQVLYTRRSGNAYHRALQTSWRGWADSKAVHSMECIGARSLYWRTLSQ